MLILIGDVSFSLLIVEVLFELVDALFSSSVPIPDSSAVLCEIFKGMV